MNIQKEMTTTWKNNGKIFLFSVLMMLTFDALALDYCKMYGEDDALCYSQRLKEDMGLTDPRKNKERTNEAINRCNEGDRIACALLCKEGLREACRYQ